MKVVMGKSEAEKFKTKSGIATVLDEIHKLTDDYLVVKSLESQLGSNFEKWYSFTITHKNPNKAESNKRRYEAFVTGYLYFYDQQVKDGLVDHLIYFKWDGDTVTVFISPPATVLSGPTEITFTIIPKMVPVNPGAGSSDPPPPPPPPPPNME